MINSVNSCLFKGNNKKTAKQLMPRIITYVTCTRNNKNNGATSKTVFVMPFGTYYIIDELLKKFPKQEPAKDTGTVFVIPTGSEDLIGLF